VVGKSSQKVTFTPTPTQIKFLNLYLVCDKKLTLEKIGEEIGVTRKSIWKWFQKEDFVDWVNSKKDELLKGSLMSRYKTAVRKATAGDFNFSKLLFEMQGEYVQKSESKVTNVYDGYEKMTDEEIIEEFTKDLDRYTKNRPQGMDTKINKTKKD